MMIHLVGSRFAPLLQAVPPPTLTPDQQFEIAKEALRNGAGPAGVLVPLAFFATILVIAWRDFRGRIA
jgi:hypothetical protein